MKTAAVAIIDMEYFKVKEQYIMDNYEISNFFSLYQDEVGESLYGTTILSINEIVTYKDIKTVVMAVPLSSNMKNVNLLLFQIGVKAEDIVLLLDKPNYVVHEDICTAQMDVMYSICSTGDIVCRIEGRDIIVAHQPELSVLKDVYVARCYDIAHPYESSIVLDIGMNIGVASLFFAGRDDVSKIYSFEPFINTYEIAVNNLKINNALDKVVPMPFGLGNSSRKMELKYIEHAKSGMGFFANPSIDQNTQYEKAIVEIFDVADAFGEIIRKHPDGNFIFKVDCEGAEYEIFERLNEKNMLKDIGIIIMEWHNIGGHRVEEIEKILKDNNFIYHINGWRRSLVGIIFAVNANLSAGFSNTK